MTEFAAEKQPAIAAGHRHGLAGGGLFRAQVAELGGRIGVGERAADRAAMPHLRITDVAGSVGEERDVLGEHRRLLDIHVSGESTDGDVVATVSDVGQIGNPSDIDEHRWLGQTELHRGHEAVTAGEELRLVAVLADELDRLG